MKRINVEINAGNNGELYLNLKMIAEQVRGGATDGVVNYGPDDSNYEYHVYDIPEGS